MADDIHASDVTVADLKDHIATVDDPDHLDALRAEEQDGKARAGALAAIDARKAELAQGDTPPVDASDQSDATGAIKVADPAPADDHEPTAVEPLPDTERSQDGDAEPKAGEPVTAVAEINRPADMTDDEINRISGGGLAADVSGPRSEVAEQLRITREMADDPDAVHPYAGLPTFGAGPGADIG